MTSTKTAFDFFAILKKRLLRYFVFDVFPYDEKYFCS